MSLRERLTNDALQAAYDELVAKSRTVVEQYAEGEVEQYAVHELADVLPAAPDPLDRIIETLTDTGPGRMTAEKLVREDGWRQRSVVAPTCRPWDVNDLSQEIKEAWRRRYPLPGVAPNLPGLDALAVAASEHLWDLGWRPLVDPGDVE